MPSVPRVGLVWGPGLPAARAARPSSRIRDSCPLDYFGKRLNAEAPRASRHFPSLRSRLHTQPGTASSLSGPGCLPGQPTIITLLPTAAAAAAGIRFLGMEGESRAKSGEQTWGGLLSPLHAPFPHPPPGTRPPRRHPAPGLTPSLSSQGWPLSL